MKTILSLLVGFLMVSFGAIIINTMGLSAPISFGVAFTAAAIFGALEFAGVIPAKFAFATVCGKLNGDILKSCTNPIQAGTRDRGVVINFDDVLTITYAADGYTVTDLILASGTTAYEIEGQNNSIEPKATMVQQGFNKMWDHEVMMKGFDISPDTKLQVNNMKDGRFVIITENYFKGTAGNTAFEIYGLTAGLVLTEIERDANSEDTQGAFHFKFFTEKNKEPRSPNTLWDTSYAVSKAVVDGLL